MYFDPGVSAPGLSTSRSVSRLVSASDAKTETFRNDKSPATHDHVTPRQPYAFVVFWGFARNAALACDTSIPSTTVPFARKKSNPANPARVFGASESPSESSDPSELVSNLEPHPEMAARRATRSETLATPLLGPNARSVGSAPPPSAFSRTRTCAGFSKTRTRISSATARLAPSVSGSFCTRATNAYVLPAASVPGAKVTEDAPSRKADGNPPAMWSPQGT